jgi:hypothetical protein
MLDRSTGIWEVEETKILCLGPDVLQDCELLSVNEYSVPLRTDVCHSSAVTKLLSSRLKIFHLTRHVVSAYVSKSRCGSTREAYLGMIGWLSS